MADLLLSVMAVCNSVNKWRWQQQQLELRAAGPSQPVTKLATAGTDRILALAVILTRHEF